MPSYYFYKNSNVYSTVDKNIGIYNDICRMKLKYEDMRLLRFGKLKSFVIATFNKQFCTKVFNISMIKLFGMLIQNQLRFDDGFMEVYIIKEEFNNHGVSFDEILEITKHWFDRPEFSFRVLESYDDLNSI